MIYELDFEWTRERKNSEFFTTRKVNTFTRMCFSCVCSPDFVGVFLFHFFSLIVFVCVLKYIFFCERSNQLVFFFSLRFLSKRSFSPRKRIRIFRAVPSYHLSIPSRYFSGIFEWYYRFHWKSLRAYSFSIISFAFLPPVSPFFRFLFFQIEYSCLHLHSFFPNVRSNAFVFSSFPSFIPYLICYHIHFHKYIFYGLCFVVAVVVA